MCCKCLINKIINLIWLLLLFYQVASEGWQPPMSKEDTRESSLARKCYWHRIIPEVGGHFDPCTEQGTPTTRRRPPLVGLKECSQMHKRGWNNIEKSFSLLLIAIVRVESHQVTLRPLGRLWNVFLYGVAGLRFKSFADQIGHMAVNLTFHESS